MMGFDDRLFMLLLGIAIGFVLGYITKILQNILEDVRVETQILTEIKEETGILPEIKEELDEVDGFMKEHERLHDEKGASKSNIVTQIALGCVVVLVAMAAFQSQKAANATDKQADQLAVAQVQLEDTQNRLKAVTDCVQTTLEDAVETLGVRTQATRTAASSNVVLQQAQAKMISVLLHVPPYTKERRLKAFIAYFDALKAFNKANKKNKKSADENPYPTKKQLTSCIDSAVDRSAKEAQEGGS